MATLPLLLAGPILRRVEPKQMSVWMAFSQTQKVACSVWEGRLLTESASGGAFKPKDNKKPLRTSKETSTISFGPGLHIALVTIELQAQNPAERFEPGKTYSYNVTFNASKITFDSDGNVKNDPADRDLHTEKLLEDGDFDFGGVKRKKLALGYKKSHLPTFILPPENKANLKDLVLSHGSCRKMHGDGEKDMMGFLDNVLELCLNPPVAQPEEFKRLKVPKNAAGDPIRPQQFFLTGDQIYADEVPRVVLPYMTQLGKDMLGNDEKMMVAPDNQTAAFEADINTANFPPHFRQRFFNEVIKFTSTSAEAHLISFGEFCATYLYYWSNRVWDAELVKAFDAEKDGFKTTGSIFDKTLKNPAINLAKSATDPGKKLADIIFGPAPTPDELKDAALQEKLEKQPRILRTGDEAKTNGYFSRISPGIHKEFMKTKVFYDALPQVSRAMANIPCYMCFDDHEVTDDWNFTLRWKNRVLTSPADTGRTVIRNALMSYAVFQDWGNVPGKYTEEITKNAQGKILTGLKKNLLNIVTELSSLIQKTAPSAAEKNRRQQLVDALDADFGLLKENEPGNITWHYDLPTGFTKTLILDTRTRRAFPSLNAPPALLSPEAMDAQLLNLPKDKPPVIFIVSPVPVMGVAMIEELAQPLYGGIQAAGRTDVGGEKISIEAARLQKDYESWAFNTKAIESLLEKVAAAGTSVVFLSGDVHFGSSTVTDYWKKAASPGGSPMLDPVRIIQLTCSGFKQVWMEEYHILLNALVQNLLGAYDARIEKYGWRKRDGVKVTGKVSPQNRIRLRQEPVSLASHGWYDDAKVTPAPDWQWRYEVWPDTAKYPEDEALGAADLKPAESNVDTLVALYGKILHRHRDRMIRTTARRLVWQSQIALVSFADKDNKTYLQHGFYCQFDFLNNTQIVKVQNRSTLHEMPLLPETKEPPPPLGEKGSN